MATEVWLVFPILFVMLVSGLIVFHPRYQDSRRLKVVNLVVAAVCFAAIVALVITLVTSL
jgi:cytochrome b subunit of formate dehydrogenase